MTTPNKSRFRQATDSSANTNSRVIELRQQNERYFKLNLK